MDEINVFSTYRLRAIAKELVPATNFFRNRYFSTTPEDIFNTDKVLTEYQKGDRKMAAFVSRRVGDIPIAREGYAIHEYEPAYIAPSRLLTVDELKKRGFGEAIYANTTESQRATKLIARDMMDMRARIDRRLEWMCAQVMVNNACTMQTYTDDHTEGETLYVQFYDEISEHTYEITTKWDAEGADIIGDVSAMCDMLSDRGLPVEDLVLGPKAAAAVLANQELRDLLNKTSGIIVGEIRQRFTYPGVVFMGQLNFNGYELNLFKVNESYIDNANQRQKFFPDDGVMVTAPNCGHLMFGAVTQIDYGATGFSTHEGIYVPKLSINQEADIRKLRLASRPLAAPANYCPYIFAAEAVTPEG